MSKEKEPELVLFSRASQDGDSTADDWDDSELLKEYDKAVRPLKAIVAERMGLSNAELEEASASESCASSKGAIDKETDKILKRNQRRRRSKAKNKQLRREWIVGDHCQATYTVDNKVYEATILSINVDQGTCVLQYVGYGNTEEQPLLAISRSMGAAARREQVRVAGVDKDSEAEVNLVDDLMDCSSVASSVVTPSKGDSSTRKNSQNKSQKPGETSKNSCHGPKVFAHPNSSRTTPFSFPGMASHHIMQDMVPPPLPPHILSGLPADDSEALSAMLMSWYMSGFHTGYYQGLKRVKNCSLHQ